MPNIFKEQAETNQADRVRSTSALNFQPYIEAAREIGTLVTEKNAAYGDSFATCGEFLRLLYPDGIQPDQYTDALAMVRIFDKQKRIATRKGAFGESPYRDIAGYGLLGAVKDERDPA